MGLTCGGCAASVRFASGGRGFKSAVPTRPPLRRGPCRDGAFGAAARCGSRLSAQIPPPDWV